MIFRVHKIPLGGDCLIFVKRIRIHFKNAIYSGNRVMIKQLKIELLDVKEMILFKNRQKKKLIIRLKEQLRIILIPFSVYGLIFLIIVHKLRY